MTTPTCPVPQLRVYPPAAIDGTHLHDDLPVDELHWRYALSRDPAIRKQLVEHYDRLALSLVRQFRTRRESFEDLAQVARIGLIHAVDRFDPDRGRPFVGFARVTITGELKRHVRDKTWAMRVPRSLQEHYLAVVRAADDLTARLGRSPRIPEIAAVCDLTEEQVLEAMDLGRRQRPSSLDVPEIEGQRRSPEPGVPDRGLEHVENRALVARLLERLPERERRILELRFVHGRTQVEIAEEIGMSQMYVSRLLTRVLERMRVIAAEN
jgi:RNA polymerase sigma-B factor